MAVSPAPIVVYHYWYLLCLCVDLWLFMENTQHVFAVRVTVFLSWLRHPCRIGGLWLHNPCRLGEAVL